MPNFKESFEELYDRYLERIFRFVFVKVNSRELAEDLCSEIFSRFWKKYQEIDIENPQAFLYQIARNVVADYYRSRKPQTVNLEEVMNVVDINSSKTEEEMHRSLEMEKVYKAIRLLNEDYQNFIIWYYLEELSVPEIVQIVSKTENSVRVAIHRSLHALKQQLERV
ncbi:MAG: sigma-70 family RNA polymerase sigma factor [Candidatus Wildermuthbacteria bacterium]|nr:sigma-70 family RNA polymerase sigma factor [Candidatus Wildermuthbacteria bacterium]